jgi:pimeloyl-ACP methyl ester carboxylesterase
MPVPTLPGVTAETITTHRLTTRVLFAGAGTPVLFLHGNASSATFWEEVMLALPEGYRAIAPDQRAYGDADPLKKIDARRGMGDLADDAIALLDYLGYDRVHVAGHSLGGAVIWRLLMDHPQRFLSATLVCPGSPFGYGGTKDLDGTPHWDDAAGSGGGIVNQQFTQRMAAGDRSAENPQSSPRVVMNNFYFKPPFIPSREEDLLSSVLSSHVGKQDYPGDFVPSAHWPGVAPGIWGPTNALSPKYQDDINRLYAIDPKPPILWVRGSHDQIVADQSLFEIGTLGLLGVIPGYPGIDVYPPQPMIGQTRAVLEKYAAAGGWSNEVVMEDTGHSPFIEQPDVFNSIFHGFLAAPGRG